MITEKQFQNLTITDDFVFCTVFSQNEDLCRELAERILDRKISKIVYLNSQQSIQITSDGKGVRFGRPIPAIGKRILEQFGRYDVRLASRTSLLARSPGPHQHKESPLLSLRF